MHFREVDVEVNALVGRAVQYFRVGPPFCDVARACMSDLYGHLVCIIRPYLVLLPSSDIRRRAEHSFLY